MGKLASGLFLISVGSRRAPMPARGGLLRFIDIQLWSIGPALDGLPATSASRIALHWSLAARRPASPRRVRRSTFLRSSTET